MKKAVLTKLLLCLLIQTAFAQIEKRYLTKKINSSITIDGMLDEASWKLVDWEGDFIQTEPQNGAKPTFHTQFKILRDNVNLYVGIRAFDASPDSVLTPISPRDFFDGDWVEINIDSDFDKKDAFSFTITAAGIRGDEHIITSQNWLNDWNPNWTAKTTIDSKGWMAEMKIPFKELEIREKKQQWGIQVNRSMGRIDESSSWTSIPNEDKWVEYFGVLEGIEDVPISRKISITTALDHQLAKQDFIDLYATLQSSYPSLYRYHSKEYIDQQYQQVLNALNKEVTLIEFYKLILSFMSQIGDGHIQIKLPNYIANSFYEKLKKFPFELKVTKDEVFIVANHSGNHLLEDSRLIAINNKSIQDIINEMVDLIPSDGYNLTSKYYMIADDFEKYYTLITEEIDKEKVRIELIPKDQDQVYSINLDWLSKANQQKIKSSEEAYFESNPLHFQIKDSVGILTISTFNNVNGFHEFIDQSFKKLSESKTNKLILDLRDNGGGEESNAIHLYSYLSSKPFKYYNRYEVNVKPNQQVPQQSTLISYETINFFSSLVHIDNRNRTLLNKLKGLEGKLIDPTKLNPPKINHHFNGEVLVLINGKSFSATSEICTILKRDQRAEFMGEETGGTADGNTSGIYDQITLPYSRLKIRIPLLKYVMETGDWNFLFGRGIIPDFPMKRSQMDKRNIENDQLVNFALKYLNEEK